MPTMGPFQFLSSQVITAPEPISVPVPETVTTAPAVMPEVGIFPYWYSMDQMSSSRTAWAETTLQQSTTLPPPTARMKST